MGLRGPQPTPTALLRLRGSHRADARNGEPETSVEAPKCPDWLSEEAKAEWRRLVPELKDRRTITKSDRAALAGMCAAWAEIVESHAAIAKLAEPGAAKFSGHMIDHPRVVLNRAFERWIKLSDRFGLSPAAKTRVRAASGEEQNADSRVSYFNEAG